MEKYCLGFGDWSIYCPNCLYEKNWLALNELPNAERLARQSSMERVDEKRCALTKRSLYAPANIQQQVQADPTNSLT